MKSEYSRNSRRNIYEKIGLVGGTGPESTLMYYKELNSKIDQLTDGKAMQETLVLNSRIC